MRVTSTAVLCLLLALTDAFTEKYSFSSHKRSSYSTTFARELNISSEHPSEKRRGLPLPSKTCLNYASTTLPDSSDPYVILNLDPSSVDLKEIKKAYRKMALLYHPDARDEADKKVANEEFARVNAAYALLTGKSDEVSKAYDQSSAQNKKPKQTQWKDNSDAYRRVRINWGDEEYAKATTADSRNWWNNLETTSIPSPDNVQGFDIHGNPVNRSKKPNPNPSTRAHHSPSGAKGTGFNDFAMSAQVREYDSNGYPKVKENHRVVTNDRMGMQKAPNGFATYGSYSKMPMPDFSTPKVPSPDNVLGFDIHGNPVVRTSQSSANNQGVNSKSSTFRDFAANAQVRDYDANGNPIENPKSTISSHPDKPYHADQHIQSSHTDPASNTFIQDFAVRAQVRNNDVNGNPIADGVANQRETSIRNPPNTSYPSNHNNSYIRDFAKYAKVRNYDMSGNSVAQDNVKLDTNQSHSNIEGKDNMQFRAKDDFDQDFHKNPINDFSLTVGNDPYKEQPPSPDKVQRYDIYGNPIERNSSVECQGKDEIGGAVNEIKTDTVKSTSESNEEIPSATTTPKSVSFDKPISSSQSYTNGEEYSTVEGQRHNKIRTASADYDKRMDEFDKWMQELDSESTQTTTNVNTRGSEAKTSREKPRETTANIPHDVMDRIHLEDLYQKERYTNQNNDPTNPTVRRPSRTSAKSKDAYLRQYEKYTSQERKNSAEEGDLPSFLTSVDDQSSQENPRMMSKIYDFFFPKASYVN